MSPEPEEGLSQEEMDNAFVITPGRMICARHGEPFRSLWPKGYAMFAVEGMRRLDPEQIKKDIIKARLEGTSIKQQYEYLLDKKPLCCRLGDEKMLAFYTEAELGRPGRCEICHERRLGGPLRVRNFWKRAKFHNHVCHVCLLTKIQIFGTNN